MNIKPALKFWACIDANGHVDTSTIHWKRTHSIEEFCKGVSKPWKWFRRKYGYQCVRVNIHFEEWQPVPKKVLNNIEP